jgi:hypothetical protein
LREALFRYPAIIQQKGLLVAKQPLPITTGKTRINKVGVLAQKLELLKNPPVGEHQKIPFIEEPAATPLFAEGVWRRAFLQKSPSAKKNPQALYKSLGIAPCLLDPRKFEGRQKAAILKRTLLRRHSFRQRMGQVFWLVDSPKRPCLPLPSRKSGKLPGLFVPTHSGGTATDFNRLPS